MSDPIQVQHAEEDGRGAFFVAREGVRLAQMTYSRAGDDLVIIDSPPVAAVSDSLILGGLVDRSIYVIRWRETPRNLVIAGMRQMLDAGANLAGVVLSRVDLIKHARYEYADSGSYRGSYRKYYSN